MFRFSGLLIGSILLVFVLTLGQISAAASEPDRASGLPVGASADWWSRVQRSIQLEEYGVVAVGAVGDRFRATNPAQDFEARFDAGGLRLSPTGEANWEWGLSLNAWGRPGALDSAAVERLSADEDRVELDRGQLTEWFVNRPDGLEHGFTIPIPPRGDGDRLVFDLALTGGLRPVFSEDGQAVDFFSAGNVSVLRYAKLIVTDAAGTVLPARIDPVAGGMRIVVEESGAIYPITVNRRATRASWTATGEAAGDQFGFSVKTAGDVNGDGYSDVVVGAPYWTGQTGAAYLYLGSASGLSGVASWSAAGEAAGDEFGRPVSTAGDVNGDGYSDVVVAAADNNSHTGKAYLYLGGGGGGLSLVPQQWRQEQHVPIAQLGRSDSWNGFRIRLRGRSPFGGGRARLEWEVKPLRTLFDGLNTGMSASWTELAGGTAQFSESVTALAEDTPYHWRARLRYDGTSTPYQQFSRWITKPHNGWNETDLRTSLDADADGHAWGIDCDDADPNNWSSCATCVDADSDGWHVDCDAYVTIAGPDCDDGNVGAHEPGAGEVNDGLDNHCPGETGYGSIDEIAGCGFYDPGDKNELSWTTQPGATSYEVARSTDPQFPFGCTTTMTSSTYWSDIEPVPDGACHRYLVRSLAPHVGSWGAASSGERTWICP